MYYGAVEIVVFIIII